MTIAENSSQMELFSKALIDARKKGVARWYSEGSAYPIAWIKKHYRMSGGDRLRWDEPFMEQYYTILACPWIERLIVTKPSQVGFTESLIAIASFLVCEICIPAAMGFEQEGKLRGTVAPRIQPSFDHIDPIKKRRLARWNITRRKDVDKQEKITVGGIELTFFSAHLPAANKEQRRASPKMSSFTAFVVLADEIELWAEGAIDIATERQSACTMPTKPFRAGSTPGVEGGIVDSQIKQSGMMFQWFVTCPHCGTRQNLDAFGNFLKPVMVESEGEGEEERFVDMTGRPYEWFCHDESDRQSMIDTAYIGCRHCEQELTWEAIKAGIFESGNKTLTDFCREITQNKTPVIKPVAIDLPRLASSLFRPSERIYKLVYTSDPADQLQQGLGKTVSLGGGKISLKKLMDCVGRTAPGDRPHDLIVLGLDQGKAANWVQIQKWYLGREGDWERKWLEAFKEVIWTGQIHGFPSEDFLREHQVNLIGMDNEPEIQLAADYARKHPHCKLSIDLSGDLKYHDMHMESGLGQTFLFDQLKLKGEKFKISERDVQGEKVPVYALHRSFGLDSVRTRIYRGQQGLPSGSTYDPGDDLNLIYHYLTSDRRMDGQWVQVPGAPDHLFHADNFAEMAVLAAGYVEEPNFAFGSRA
jgi:hypothetical protein